MIKLIEKDYKLTSKEISFIADGLIFTRSKDKEDNKFRQELYNKLLEEHNKGLSSEDKLKGTRHYK